MREAQLANERNTELTQVPLIELSDGAKIPQLGFGTWQIDPEDAGEAVTKALDVGYRAIDTAAAYENEAEVGGAINGSAIDRSELFVTTKLWNDSQGADATKAAFEESLSKLGLDYLDLYLIHWPAPDKGLFVETWKAMEELRADGRVRSIGVSNFREEDLERLAQKTDTVPVLNQVLEVGGPGDAPLADAARQRDHPQVGHRGADRGELRHLGLRALRRGHGGDRGA